MLFNALVPSGYSKTIFLASKILKPPTYYLLYKKEYINV
jgi:hypothetical protein